MAFGAWLKDKMSEQSETPEPKYDVAISFLSRDEALASSLNDKLDGLKVFFFPRKQEELAGTNGLESMREPFQTARIVVVLYRQPWGNTNWTRVEQAAITDRFLKQGWDWLLFVQLDNAGALPVWLPDTHVRFAFEQYGIEQLAGAIKFRVQQRGGRIEPPSAVTHARRVQREAELLADQKSLFRDQRWIEGHLHYQIEALMSRLVTLTDEIKTGAGMNFVAGVEGKRCVLRDNRVSMNVGWRQSYVNSVEDEAEIIAAEFNGPLYVRTELMWTVGIPQELQRHRFTPALSESREVRWKEAGQKSEPLSTEELAHRIMTLFVDLLNRTNKGQVDFVHF
jgi:hypothetical protein